MSDRSDSLLLQDILDSIEKIERYVAGFDKSSFLADPKTEDAVARNFEIIGEATSRMTQVFKTKNAEISWRILKDFRNRLIHDYMGTNFETVWEVIQMDLPQLKKQLIELSIKIHSTDAGTSP